MSDDLLFPLPRRYEFTFKDELKEGEVFTVAVESDQPLGFLIAKVCLDKGLELDTLLRVKRVFNFTPPKPRELTDEEALAVIQMASKGERR